MDRVLRNTASTLFVTFYSDETPTSADGAVTVTVTRDDGSVVATDAATSAGDIGVYGYVLPPQADVALLTLAWTGDFSGTQQTVYTRAEVVGGRILTLGEARNYDTSLSSTVKYPTATLARARAQVEDEFESICDLSFIPRYGRIEIRGSGNAYLYLGKRNPSQILWATSNTGGTVAALSEATINGIVLDKSGWAVKVDGSDWDERVLYTLGIEHGLSIVPSDVNDAALLRLRHRVQDNNTGIPDRATSISNETGTYALATAGFRGFQTGIPDVDAVLKRYMTGPGVY